MPKAVRRNRKNWRVTKLQLHLHNLTVTHKKCKIISRKHVRQQTKTARLSDIQICLSTWTKLVERQTVKHSVSFLNRKWIWVCTFNKSSAGLAKCVTVDCTSGFSEESLSEVIL